MPSTTIATGQGEPRILFGPLVQAAVERAIANIPPEKRGHVELRITIQGDVEAEAAIRLFRGADASAFWQRTTNGQQAGGARVRWSF